MKAELSGNAEVFSRLDQAYACWEEGMWRERLFRRFRQFTAVIKKSSYEPGATETGFPVDGAHKTKQLLLEAVTRGNLDYLLPAFYSKGITAKKPLSMEEIQRADTLTAEERAKFYNDEETAAAVQWEEFHFPYYLGKWSSSSRRIYYIPSDLMLLLETTSLKGLTFRDIHMPFPSFAIALETPLVVEGEDKKLDFFLIGDFSIECFALYGFARSLSNVKVVDPALRAKIDAAAKKGNLRRFMQLTKKEIKKLKRGSGVTSHWQANISRPGIISEAEVDEDLERMLLDEEKDSRNHITRFVRVFIGLCLYLNTFKGSHADVTERIPNITKVYAGAKDGPALVDAAEVCRVQSVVKLSAEDRVIIRDQLSGRGGWEVRAHFREGFWRRPRGEGHNPAAVKTIWVRPTLVRRDRLPDNTLPLGVGKVIP